MFKFRHYQVPFVASLFVLASLACGSYSRPNEQTIHTATPPTATAGTPLGTEGTAAVAEAVLPTVSPVATVPNTPPTYLGDQVERDGYSLAALAVEDPATRPLSFFAPQAGKKLIAVEFIAGNVAGEQFTSNVLRATLLDKDGFLYGAENTVVDGEIELLEVNPGERVQGWAAFLVPESAQAATLKYEFSGAELTVGLSPRP